MLSLRFISDRRLLSKNMRKLNWKNERRGKATLLDCVTLILFCRVVWLSFFRHFFFSGMVENQKRIVLLRLTRLP